MEEKFLAVPSLSSYFLEALKKESVYLNNINKGTHIYMFIFFLKHIRNKGILEKRDLLNILTDRKLINEIQ